MVWMCLSLLDSYVKILVYNVMVLGGGNFGEWLHYEGSTLQGAWGLEERPYPALQPPHLRLPASGTEK